MKRVAITPGEPAGIGPDLIIKLASEYACQRSEPAEWVVIADRDLLMDRAAQLEIPFSFSDYNKHNPPTATIKIANISAANQSCCGTPDKKNVDYVLETLKFGAAGCLENEFDALITGPVDKSIINQAGIPFSGHTEFFAHLAGVPRTVMLLQTEGLRVALATTHLPLASVPAAITQDSLEEVITILRDDLVERFCISHPKIYVCGLNPHAGEAGYLGTEEIEIILPVIKKLHSKGFNLIGPLPADTVFTKKYLTDADCVLAMYHDQGLPVLKYKGFGRAVNITLGLPFIRTSVDHGTAIDIAGTGKANVSSLRYAIDTALEMTDA